MSLRSQYVHGTGVITKKPKTESSVREIIIPEILNSILRKYKVWHNEQRLSAGELWKGANRVFTTWDGEPMFPDSSSKWFAKFVKRYNLPKLSFHGLRHTHATILANDVKNIRSLAGRLGHAQPTTTWNIYSHMIRSADMESASKLDQIFLHNEKKEAK